MDYMEYISHIGDTRATGYLMRNLQDKQGVWVSRATMAATEGNAYYAMVLAQVLYWFDLNPETRNPRVKYNRGGRLWVVKTWQEWADELLINSKHTVAKAFSYLEDAGFVTKEQHKSPMHNGQVASHISLNWAAWLNHLDTFYGGATYEVDPGTIQQVDSESTYEVVPSYTDNTTEKKPPPSNFEPSPKPGSSVFDAVTTDDEPPSAVDELETAYREATNAIALTPSHTDYARLRAMHEAGITPEDIRKFVEDRKRDSWWRDKRISLKHIAESIGDWKKAYTGFVHVHDQTTPTFNWYSVADEKRSA